MRYIAIVLLMSSCSLIKPIVSSNPEPSLRSIHMWENHRDYTLEQYNNHPDRNCEDLKL